MTPNGDFVGDLLAQVRVAMAEGSTRFLFWGYNDQCIALLAAVREIGLPDAYIVGIADERSEVQGKLVHGFTILAPCTLQALDIDAVVIMTDVSKERALVSLAASYSGAPRVILAGMQHLEFADAAFDEILQSCLVKSYANGYRSSLIHLYQAIQYLAASGLSGSVAEFGICKGGTIVFIKKVLEHFGLRDADVFGFDIFDGFPARRSPLDLYRHAKCEFRDYATVTAYCERFGVKVIKGDICDTYSFLEGKPLILSFFDTDNYSPAKAALNLCVRQTARGGIIFFDHYTTERDYLYTIGERIAANEFLTARHFFNPHGTGLFIKIS